MSRACALIGVVLAGWPVLRWYVARLHDGSDEPLGLLALALAVAFAPRAGWHEPVGRRRWFLLFVGVGGLLVAPAGTPMLARALLFAGMIGVAVAPRSIALAWTALLALALPLMATLQFFLGYPLRVATTILSAFLLRLGGLEVHASGTTLLWAGERVMVDAPCSGLQMAWSGAVVAGATACWLKLPARETLRLLRWAGAIVFLANLLRSIVLFLMGAGLWRLPQSAHEGAGLVLFAGAVAAIYRSAVRFSAMESSRRAGASEAA